MTKEGCCRRSGICLNSLRKTIESGRQVGIPT